MTNEGRNFTHNCVNVCKFKAFFRLIKSFEPDKNFLLLKVIQFVIFFSIPAQKNNIIFCGKEIFGVIYSIFNYIRCMEKPDITQQQHLVLIHIGSRLMKHFFAEKSRLKRNSS